MMKKVFSIAAALCVSLYAAVAVQADESPEVKACRSVHLFYPAPDSIAFYNEVTVEKSEPGTYFMVNGFSMGYFGIQDHGDEIPDPSECKSIKIKKGTFEMVCCSLLSLYFIEVLQIWY